MRTDFLDQDANIGRLFGPRYSHVYDPLLPKMEIVANSHRVQLFFHEEAMAFVADVLYTPDSAACAPWHKMTGQAEYTTSLWRMHFDRGRDCPSAL